jgi:integrase/recombinase XerD
MANRVPVALTATELRALLTVTREQNFHFYVFCLVTLSHGLRVSETIALRRRNFSVEKATVYLRVQRLKGSLETTQRLNNSPDPLLDESAVVSRFIEKLLPNDLLFTDHDGGMLTRQQIDYLIKKFGMVAGLPEHKRFIHACKHSTGVLMRQAGCKLEEIQAALGHKNLNSTAQYLRVSTDEVDDARARAFDAAAGPQVIS